MALALYIIPPPCPPPPAEVDEAIVIIFARASSMQSLASRRNASIASTFRELLSAVSAIMMHVAAMPATTSSADMFRKVSMTWLMFGGNGGFSKERLDERCGATGRLDVVRLLVWWSCRCRRRWSRRR